MGNDGEKNDLDMAFLKNIPQQTKCMIKIASGQKWFDDLNSLKVLENNTKGDMPTTKLNKYWLEKIEQYTEKLYVKEMEIYVNLNSENNVSSEKAWINMVLKNGTLPDKMSAFSVLLQDDPVHNLPSLEALVNMVSLKSRRPCMLALDALRDLFCNQLLPKDRKLNSFPFGQQETLANLIYNNCPGNEILNKCLVLMSFENKIKVIYKRFLEALDGISKDTVEQTKLKSMKTIFDLLVANPEQEASNLARLVNKLGDTTRGIAAKAGYQLNKLLEVHPVMKNVVLGEVERLLYRPNVSKRAQYYGICCLSQLMLDGYEEESAEIATKLIGIYFSFFKLFAVNKGDLDSKLISALLTGVNRAYPYLNVHNGKDPLHTSSLVSHMETMYRVVHLTTNFGTALQALTLLFQLSGGATNPLISNEAQETSNAITSPERFYSTLYKKLLDISGISHSSAKQALFLNLVYKAMKSDTEVNRSLAFIRRLLQACAYLPSHLVCSILYLLSELFKNRPDIKQAFKNILSKPQAPISSSTIKSSRYAGNDLSNCGDESSTDDEFYTDVKSDDECEQTKATNSTAVPSSWVFKKSNTVSQKSEHGRVKSMQGKYYDPEHRNPLYALGSNLKQVQSCHDPSQCSWELSELYYQFHPSVQLFVKHLLEDNGPSPIVYSGDPLNDFTLIRFLDRFVFRNPKKDPGKGKPTSVFGKRNVYRPVGVKNLAVDGKEYAGISDTSKIPADERFIHTYFRKYSSARANQLDDHPNEDDDTASINSDDFDVAIRSSSKVDLDFASALDAESDDDSDNEEEEADKQASSEDDEKMDGSGSDFEEVDDFDNLSDDMISSEDDINHDMSQIARGKEKTSQSKVTKISGAVRPGKRKASYDLASLIASAEDYEQLIEEDNANDMDGASGSINAVFNKDKSSVKQMKWEAKRRNGRGDNMKKPNIPKVKNAQKWGKNKKVANRHKTK